MSQIEQLQRRIAAAMARIGAGADVLADRARAAGDGGGAAGDAATLADLETALEEERLANAQLGERVKALKARHAEDLAALRAELDASAETVAGLQAGVAGAEDRQAENERLTAEVETLKAALAAARAAAAKAAETQQAEIARLTADLAQAARAEVAQAEIAALRGALEEHEDILAKLDMEAQRLRLANDRLRETNAELRQANADGLAEPRLINRAMLAEIEGLRAARAADAAEAGAVLKKLDSLLANARNLPEGEED